MHSRCRSPPWANGWRNCSPSPRSVGWSLSFSAASQLSGGSDFRDLSSGCWSLVGWFGDCTLRHWDYDKLGFPQMSFKSSIFIGFSMINHPAGDHFWTPPHIARLQATRGIIYFWWMMIINDLYIPISPIIFRIHPFSSTCDPGGTPFKKKPTPFLNALHPSHSSRGLWARHRCRIPAAPSLPSAPPRNCPWAEEWDDGDMGKTYGDSPGKKRGKKIIRGLKFWMATKGENV